MQIEYTEVLTGELKADCYAGDNCDQQEKYWNVYAEGDMQDEDLKIGEHLVINPAMHPPGTKIIIKEPVCPKCGLTFIDCNDDPDCDFSWSEFTDELYS